MSCLFNSIQLPPPVRSLLFPCASTHSPLLPLPWVYNRVWARSGRVETRSCSKTIYLLHLLACLLFIPYHLLFCIFCILHSVQCTTAICGHFLFYFYLNYLTFFCFSFLDLSFFLSLSLSFFFFFSFCPQNLKNYTWFSNRSDIFLSPSFFFCFLFFTHKREIQARFREKLLLYYERKRGSLQEKLVTSLVIPAVRYASFSQWNKTIVTRWEMRVTWQILYSTKKFLIVKT